MLWYRLVLKDCAGKTFKKVDKEDVLRAVERVFSTPEAVIAKLKEAIDSIVEAQRTDSAVYSAPFLKGA